MSRASIRVAVLSRHLKPLTSRNVLLPTAVIPRPLTPQSTAAQSESAPASTAIEIATADICDEYDRTSVTLLPLQFRQFGKCTSFHGPALCIQVDEDNALVRKTLGTSGAGRVLVIDGGGSMRCALVGDQLASLAVQNNWAGIIVNGPIRDSHAISQMNIGIKALGTAPLKAAKAGKGTVGGKVTILGIGRRNGPEETVDIATGDYVYADDDGVLISKKRLHDDGGSIVKQKP